MIKYALPLVLCSGAAMAQDAPIVHDAEYYILEAQHAEQWAEDDAAVDAALAEFREGYAVWSNNIYLPRPRN